MTYPTFLRPSRWIEMATAIVGILLIFALEIVAPFPWFNEDCEDGTDRWLSSLSPYIPTPTDIEYLAESRVGMELNNDRCC